MGMQKTQSTEDPSQALMFLLSKKKTSWDQSKHKGREEALYQDPDVTKGQSINMEFTC